MLISLLDRPHLALKSATAYPLGIEHIGQLHPHRLFGLRSHHAKVAAHTRTIGGQQHSIAQPSHTINQPHTLRILATPYSSASHTIHFGHRESATRRNPFQKRTVD